MSITTITEENKHLIIGSRRFYKQWCHYNNLIAKEQQYLSTINRKSSRKLQRLYRKRSKYQKQLFDNIIAKFFRFIRSQNIDGVFIGDVKGIRKQKRNRETNRMINNYWSYDAFLNKIKSKAEEQGIKVYVDNEAWTSQRCPKCGYIHKSNRNDRVFLCRNCQYRSDADVVGARNILNNGMWSHDFIERPHQAEASLLEVSS